MNTPKELVAAITVHDEAMYLVRNVKAHLKNTNNPIRLEPSGGKIEAGETQEEAIHREVQEELQRTCTVIRKICTDVTHSDEGDFIVHMYLIELHGDMETLTTHEPNKLNGVVRANAQQLQKWTTYPPADCILVPNIVKNIEQLCAILHSD